MYFDSCQLLLILGVGGGGGGYEENKEILGSIDRLKRFLRECYYGTKHIKSIHVL